MGTRRDPSDDGDGPWTDGAGHHRSSDPEAHPGPRDDHDEHEHRSRWPVVAAAGASGLYGGVAISLLTITTGSAPVLVGIALAAVGTIVLLAGIVGWLDEAFLSSDRAAGAQKSRESYLSTTILFLVTDVGTFGALFVYYFFVRLGAWPPAELPPLLTSLVLVNTAILLASSATIHYAHHSLREGRRRRFLAFLGVTLVLGIVFLGGQLYEYYGFVVTEGFTLSDGVFASAFFALTGLHGLHVTLGVVAIAILWGRGVAGHYSAERDASIATVSLYWHFVDAVWIFLVLVLYVGAAV